MGFLDNVCLLTSCTKEEAKKELNSLIISIITVLLACLMIYLVSLKIPKLRILLGIIPILAIIPITVLQKCKCITEYLKFSSSFSKEELYACVAILVLSLLGSWGYVSRVLQYGFPATAKVIRSRANIGSKLFREIKDIVENIVFRDGTLPHVARERIMHTLRMNIEDYGNLVQILVTGLSMLYMFFIVVSFLSFMSSMFNPSLFIFMVTFLTFVFSIIIMSKSPVHDYAITELKDKVKIMLPISIICMIISLAVVHDLSIAIHVFLISFFASGLALLKSSRKIDKIDNAVVWDRVLNLRLIRGVPVDQALMSVLGRDVYYIYTRTYPFNAIKNLLAHLEDIGGLGIIKMFREIIVEIFNSINKVVKNVRINILMLVGFAAAMIIMQIWFATMLLPALKMMKSMGYTSTAAPGYIALPIQMSPGVIIQSLDITATYVPPVVTLATFLIIRGCSSSTRAMKISLIVAIVLVIIQLLMKFLIIPQLESTYI